MAPLPNSALKFAVVREDPRLESRLVERLGARAALVVASGGCTALTLAARHRTLRVVAFDVNPRQLAHVEAKLAAARAGDAAGLNVDTEDPAGLNQCGAFEGLFRVLRRYVEEFVAPPRDLDGFFAEGGVEVVRRWTASPYWPAAFTTAFNEGLLVAMFGPSAIRHAAPGSYPAYFQRVFERGLEAPAAHRNPFLQHVFLGKYLARDAPEYTQRQDLPAPTLVRGSLLEVEGLEEFRIYSLSNVFDWSDDALVEQWAGDLARAAPPGSVVLLRQLNNQRDLRRFFRPAFTFDDALGRELQEADRSLFYERIEVAWR